MIFANYNPQNCTKKNSRFFVESRNFFLQKLEECHFWANVVSRQPQVRASRASPSQKYQNLRVVYSSTFQGLHFCFHVHSDG